MMDVNLEVFQGPYELLCALIEKNKIDIYDIPIAMLTDQYIQYVSHMLTLDLESVSEFLLMTATLLEIKSRRLLPRNPIKEDEEKDPESELIRKLEEYKLYKKVSEFLNEKQEFSQEHFYHTPEPLPQKKYTVAELMDGVSLEELKRIFDDVIKRQEKKPKPLSNITVSRERFSLSEKIEYVYLLLQRRKKVCFSDFCAEIETKEELITTFLAILELFRQNKISVSQESNFAELYLHPLS